jgi:hypothetical protein
MKKENNYAFIDSQNLNLGISKLNWKLDFEKFRVYLKEKYKVSQAFLFIGFIPENQNLYLSLKEDNYILIFKPILLFSKIFVREREVIKSNKSRCKKLF